MKVLGIAGSLRRASYNRALIEAARALAPAGVVVDPFELGGIPLYNGDLEADGLRPSEVERFKKAIADTDALLVATPEYNYGVSGVLKNAIDRASRPAMRSPLAGKPVAIMGAATSVIGTARAQQDLKLVLMGCLSLVMSHAGVVVGQAAEKFDASGTLIHEPTRKFLASFLHDFEAWTQRVGAMRTT